jgi:predicted transcriptional regulator
MTIDLSLEIEARLQANARAEGISVRAYVERLIAEEESRIVRVAAFGEAIRERLESLDSGESADGEEVMTRLLTKLNSPRRQSRDARKACASQV